MKIGSNQGGFTETLDFDTKFGRSLASLGDFDGDQISDIAVEDPWKSDGGHARGAVWILCLRADGTVKSQQKISAFAGAFTGILDDDDHFGISLAGLGALDNDGTVDLAATATGDDDGGDGKGAVWILFLNPDGTVKSHQKISDTKGSFIGQLDIGDQLGDGIANLGGLDRDGIIDIGVGTFKDDDGGPDANTGAVWLLFLNANGTVKSQREISAPAGNFTGVLTQNNRFGGSIANLGDLDGGRRSRYFRRGSRG